MNSEKHWWIFESSHPELGGKIDVHVTDRMTESELMEMFQKLRDVGFTIHEYSPYK